MSNKRFIQAFTAGAAVTGRTIVKFDAADNEVIEATGATDLMFGVADILDRDEGETVDVVLSGIADCIAAGNITRGALVTATTGGEAVAAAPSAGVNNRVVGIAMASAVSGDYFPVLINPHQIQGA